jgi:hypothetical protein
MTKYDPLSDYLRRKKDVVVELSFTDIERVIGAMLPKRALLPEWWANGTPGTEHLQSRAWREAGYEAFLLKGKDRVLFQRRTDS